MPLIFQGGEPYFEPVEKTLCWYGSDGIRMVACKVTCSAIDDLYRATDLAEDDRRIIFNRHRDIFEAVASKKYDSHLRTQQGRHSGGDQRHRGPSWQVWRIPQAHAREIRLTEALYVLAGE